MSIITKRKQLDALTPSMPMPVHPSGCVNNVYIAWHAKGVCFENCSQVTDHNNNNNKPFVGIEKEEVSVTYAYANSASSSLAGSKYFLLLPCLKLNPRLLRRWLYHYQSQCQGVFLILIAINLYQQIVLYLLLIQN